MLKNTSYTMRMKNKEHKKDEIPGPGRYNH